jgi:hypothetical protein
LDTLRFAPDVRGTAEYFEMAYGLWNAFFLIDLPPSLTTDETSEASRLCNKVTDFLLSAPSGRICNADRCVEIWAR